MQAIILSRKDFREHDQIISLYTRDKGKLELLARGVKKITSKNAAHLEPFSVVDIEMAFGKEIDHLTKVQPIEYFVNIRKDFAKSLAAGYIVNLADKLIQSGERDERIFFLLKEWLEYNNIPHSTFHIHSIDGYIVQLLYYLGFDILYSDKISGVEIKKDLEILHSGDWQLVNNLQFEQGEYDKLHNFIYEFLVFQSEKKVEDWGKLVNTV